MEQQDEGEEKNGEDHNAGISSMFASQCSKAEGGQEIEVCCPECHEMIDGTYLSLLRCPHCNIMLMLDDNDFIIWHEVDHETCPDCGRVFRGSGKLEFPTQFDLIDKKVRNFIDDLDRKVLDFLK